ncbi:MAG: M15 family metallopeptidase [Actinomycetota bacterium]
MNAPPTPRRRAAAVLVAGVAVLLSACGDGATRDDVAPVPSRPTVAPTVPATPVVTVPVTTPVFAATVTTVTASDLGASWRAGCPVGPDQLRRLTLSYRDFDGRAQTGALVVHTEVTDAVTAIFRRLFDARVPIRRMETVDRYAGSDDASMAADNTSAFNCRRAVTSGPPQWSAHAYGRAIDVNPVENPYVLGDKALPPAGAAFVDRTDVRPGMASPGSALVEAFAASGWQWGGRWAGSPDYQHFSADGT